MAVRVEVTYDMSRVLGVARLELDAATVGEAVAATRERFGDATAEFDRLAARAAIAVNGVLARHLARLETPLGDGDRVTFVKAAAGG
jgi:molybdopterin converting factor small subunit